MKPVVSNARLLEDDVDGNQVDRDEKRDCREDDENGSGEVIDGRLVDVHNQGRDDEGDGRLKAGEERKNFSEFSLGNNLGQHGSNHNGRSG